MGSYGRRMSKPPSKPEHPKPAVILIDASGNLTATVDGEPVDPDQLMSELTTVLREAENDRKDSSDS
jgi:biopolymer transport protein ExbD